ncbi:MAG: prolipoprotein diacylglyceryl transferase [Kofleriaceae bacterium]
MYAALLVSAGATGATLGFPYLYRTEVISGFPVQTFGLIVAAGVLIGAWILRLYAEWHGIDDEHIRKLTIWVAVTGFIGAHVFDVLAYDWKKMSEPIAIWPPTKWPVLLRIWDGISSYGGFVGGALGWAFYVWWKRLPWRLMADVTVAGLLPAFSIGRLGCTVVSDHIGTIADSTKWYAALAMNYPADSPLVAGGSASVVRQLFQDKFGPSIPPDATLAIWNLGLLEFFYLIPVNAIVLWLAFRPSKRMPAGFVPALTGALYAPVRFFLDYLRPETTDPRHLGFTFAQWCSIIAFGAAVYLAMRILRSGKPAAVVAPTAMAAQEQLKVVLREEKPAELPKAKAAAVAKKPEPAEPDPAAEARRKLEEEQEAEAEQRRKAQDAALAAKEGKERAAKSATAEATAAAKSEQKTEQDDEGWDPDDDARPASASSKKPAADALDHSAPNLPAPAADTASTPKGKPGKKAKK